MAVDNLHAYTRLNRLEELETAIKNNANVNAKDEFGAAPLHYAVAHKNANAVEMLLEHGADVTAKNKEGKTALHHAIEYNLYSVADALLKRNPGIVAIADNHGNEPLWTAAFNARDNYELVLLLLRYGADPDHRNNANLTPLDIPKRKKNDSLLQILESHKST